MHFEVLNCLYKFRIFWYKLEIFKNYNEPSRLWNFRNNIKKYFSSWCNFKFSDVKFVFKNNFTNLNIALIIWYVNQEHYQIIAHIILFKAFDAKFQKNDKQSHNFLTWFENSCWWLSGLLFWIFLKFKSFGEW